MADATKTANDPEAEYYQSIEEFFVSRRGDPLFLSNADWTLIHKWRDAGIPLRVVLRGVADALDAHAHSWGRGRKVGSLAYCAAEVDVARERWGRALQGGGQEAERPVTFLREYADALSRAMGLGPNACLYARRLAAQLRERATVLGETRSLETWLGECEAELLRLLRAETPRSELGTLEGEIERDLGPYRARLPPRVWDQIHSQALARRLLEAHGLTRLSLFHL